MADVMRTLSELQLAELTERERESYERRGHILPEAVFERVRLAGAAEMPLGQQGAQEARLGEEPESFAPPPPHLSVVTTEADLDRAIRDQAAIAAAAALPMLEYQHERLEIARSLGVKVTALDKRVAKERADNAKDEDAPRRPEPRPRPRLDETFDRAAELTDFGNSARFTKAAQGKFLYCGGRKKWFFYDGKRWQPDDSLRTHALAKAVLKDFGKEALEIDDALERQRTLEHILASMRRRGLEDMVLLSRDDLPVEQGHFDADPFALNVENGTVDLRSGTLRQHSADDRITRLAPVPYDPAAPADRFLQFLGEIFQGDSGVIEYVRCFFGYAATGNVREDLMLICWGGGSNGKSTLLGSISATLGDYATATRPEVFLDDDSRGGGSASPQIARLAGARLVTAAELPSTGTLAENLVKSLTGGDRISARHLYAEEFEYEPTCTFVISTNNKPRIRGADEGIWRRIALLPFLAQFERGTPGCDLNLSDALAAERSGILAWLVRGSVDWFSKGLPHNPTVIDQATKNYRAEQDTLARFLAETCVVDDNQRVRQSALYRAYQAWCAGEKGIPKQRFNTELEHRGYVKKPRDGYPTWIGLGLLPTTGDEERAEEDELLRHALR